MVGKDKPKFHVVSRRMTATMFLLIGIITGTLFAFPLVLNQSHIAIAQQQPTGNSFQIDNMFYLHY